MQLKYKKKEKKKEKVAQRHQMVSGSLALLYFLLSFHGGRQGSGPNRGQSLVEWGDFPSKFKDLKNKVMKGIKKMAVKGL